jgi:hypothetical protein
MATLQAAISALPGITRRTGAPETPVIGQAWDNGVSTVLWSVGDGSVDNPVVQDTVTFGETDRILCIVLDVSGAHTLPAGRPAPKVPSMAAVKAALATVPQWTSYSLTIDRMNSATVATFTTVKPFPTWQDTGVTWPAAGMP